MAALTLDDLVHWTPVALTFEGGAAAIDWADLRGARFLEPFFDQTVARLVAGDDGRALIRTDLGALQALDRADSLDPSGFVFHVSRCGSTLVSQMLSLVPGVVVASEPEPLNALLALDPTRVDPAVQAQVLRLLIRALGRRRFGDERHLIVKPSSWNARHWRLYRAAFPAAPMIWVQRDPAAVLASLLAEPPGWLAAHPDPAPARALFGIDPPSCCDRVELAIVALEALFAVAETMAAPVWDHAAFPAAIIDEIAPSFGIELTPADRSRMLDRARRHAKRPDAPAPDRPAPLADVERAQRLRPAYLRLRGRSASVARQDRRLTPRDDAPTLVG